MIDFNFNSWDLYNKKPFGAVPIGSEVLIRVSSSNTQHIQLRTFYQSKQTYYAMKPGDEPNSYEIKLTLPKEAHVLWYDFLFEYKGKTYAYGTQDDTLGGKGKIYDSSPNSYQITLFDPIWQMPDWYTEGIMYQIFPDRFFHGEYEGFLPEYPARSIIHGRWDDSPHYFRSKEGNIDYWDFFGGNLAGIIEKLDYLKSLNISILYLNPIFESKSNHKYDTGDYLRISPEFGNEEIFRKLCDEAEKRDIRIILDGVFSHTGDDSRYFNKYGTYDSIGAYQSENSPYYPWYRFESFPDEYESWWGVKSMPNVEELNPSYQNFIYQKKNSVIRHWLRAGASGWRLDVADELPDEFIAGIKAAMIDEKPDSVLIGEVWEDASRKIAYGVLRKYFSGYELDAVMNYPFRDAFLQYILGYKTSRETDRSMMSLYENYPRNSFTGSMNLIGSHDRMRVISILGNAPRFDDEHDKECYRLTDEQYTLAKRRMKVLSAIQMTFPGVPCIYYGDEAGVQGYSDPYNRSAYPWGNEDAELIEWYKKITQLRADYKVFIKGLWYPLCTQDELLVYTRLYKNECCLCLFNRSIEDTIVFSNPKFGNHTGIELLEKSHESLRKISMPPLSAKIYHLQGDIPPDLRESLFDDFKTE